MHSTEGTAVQRLETGAYRVSATGSSRITDRYVAAAAGTRDAALLVPARRHT